jgi:hypothetical protein
LQTPYTDITQLIYNLFYPLYQMFYPTIPFGPLAWFFVLTFGPLFIAFIAVFVRGRRKKGGSGNVHEAVQRIIASTGDVSSGIAGTKRFKFLRSPGELMAFLKIEENAIQQALSAADYYAKQGDIDESMKDKIVAAYQTRLEAVRTAIGKDQELRDIVATDTAIDKARSDYLLKLAAMSGTTVEADTETAGPTSVGLPGAVGTQQVTAVPSGGAPGGGAPGGGAPSGTTPGGAPPGGGAPSGGPPGGGPPGGGPPGGAPPGGGAPSGGPPGGAPPGGGVPGGAPGGGAPGGGAPGGGPPGGSIPGVGAPSSVSSGGAPGAGSPAGGSPSGSPGGRSSLQGEMLAEMERLKALMSGD